MGATRHNIRVDHLQQKTNPKMLAPKNSLPTSKSLQSNNNKDEKKQSDKVKVPKPLPAASNDMTPQQISNLKHMEKELKRRIGHKVYVLPRVTDVYGYIFDVVVDPTALIANRIKWSFWYRGYVYAKGRTCIMQMAHDVNSLYPNKYRVAANPEDAHLGPACFVWNCHTSNGNRLKMLYSCLPRNTRSGTLHVFVTRKQVKKRVHCKIGQTPLMNLSHCQ